MEIKELFETYKDQYEGLKAALDAKDGQLVTEWSKDPVGNFVVFENERLGASLGPLLKKEPAKLKNVYQYRSEKSKLLYKAFYGEGAVTSEHFYFYQTGMTIQVTYGRAGTGKEIKRVSIVWFDENDRQTAYQHYANPMQGETLIDGKVTYPDADHVFIKETGKIGAINVDKDIEVATAPALEIYSTSNNLASGEKKRVKIFPAK